MILQSEGIILNHKSISRKIIDFSVERYKIIYLFIFLIVILGVLSYKQIPKEVYPEIRYPYAVISVSYPGASSEDVEKLVTTKIETGVSGVGDIKNITSTSYPSYSETIIKFDMNIDLSEKLRKVKEEIDNIRDELPNDIYNPVVNEYDASKDPIMQIIISGKFNKSDLGKYSTIDRKSVV